MRPLGSRRPRRLMRSIPRRPTPLDIRRVRADTRSRDGAAMVTRTLIRLGLPGLVLAGGLLLRPSRAAGGGSFPCSWNWGIDQGLPAGYVLAGINADCFGRGGSLTLGIRLFKYDERSRR